MPPETAAQDHVQTAFKYLKEQRLSLQKVLSRLHSKKVFLDAQREHLLLQFVPITSCHWPPPKKPGSAFLALSLQVFVHTEKILLSLLFSRLNTVSSPSLSSDEESPLIILVASL